MSVSNNIFNKDGRFELGFFGSSLTTKNIQVIIPYTNVGGTVISTNPTDYGAVTNTWSDITGAWCNWNPNKTIIPDDSSVQFAFLVWCTAYYPPLTPPFEVLANTLPITLIKPDGTKIQVAPEPANNLIFNAGWRQFTHGADITTIMQDNQYGDYKVTGVPTGPYGGSNGCGGWGLYIIYGNDKFKYRNANISATATGFNEVVTITNLITPVTGPVTVKVFLSSVQGDRNYKDSLLLNNVKLSGPYNPPDDFMNSRYVDYTGLNLQSKASLMNETLSQYGFYSDQTVIINDNIVKNGDTELIIKQDNSGDWAGISLLGVMTDLNSALLIPTKEVDKTYAKAGDTLLYTISFSNTGSTDAINIIVRDTLPAEVTFIPNSIKVNGVSYLGDITKGITIPDLAINNYATITFQVKIQDSVLDSTLIKNFANVKYDFIIATGKIGNSNINSNLVYTTIVNAVLNATKTVDKKQTNLNEILTYTITLNNTSNHDMFNTIFIDTIPSNTELVPNTLNQDGVFFPYNISGSILPNTIYKNSFSTITFKVKVMGLLPNPILNSASAISNIIIDNGAYTMTVPANSNIVSTGIVIIDIKTIKQVDKGYATLGDIITYTLVISNSGNTTGNNLVLSDSIPTGGSFIPNSIYVDGVNVIGSIENGINIGSLKPGEYRTVTFKVMIV